MTSYILVNCNNTALLFYALKPNILVLSYNSGLSTLFDQSESINAILNSTLQLQNSNIFPGPINISITDSNMIYMVESIQKGNHFFFDLLFFF